MTCGSCHRRGKLSRALAESRCAAGRYAFVKHRAFSRDSDEKGGCPLVRGAVIVSRPNIVPNINWCGMMKKTPGIAPCQGSMLKRASNAKKMRCASEMRSDEGICSAPWLRSCPTGQNWRRAPAGWFWRDGKRMESSVHSEGYQAVAEQTHF